MSRRCRVCRRMPTTREGKSLAAFYASFFSSELHLCSANWSLRLSWASVTLDSDARGTLNSRWHKVQMATAGVVPSHLVTRRLRFGMP